jgi:hypothetical protein
MARHMVDNPEEYKDTLGNTYGTQYCGGCIGDWLLASFPLRLGLFSRGGIRYIQQLNSAIGTIAHKISSLVQKPIAWQCSPLHQTTIVEIKKNKQTK